MKQKRFGESKRKARSEERTHNPDGIFSYSTYKKYQVACQDFGKWAKEKYNCKTLAELKRCTPEYLQVRIANGCSAWTVHVDVSALAKLFKTTTESFGVKLPPRKRAEIKRSRGETKEFSEVLTLTL